MKNIQLREPIILYISNVDLKVLHDNAACWGMTLNKAISSILQEWCNDHVASRSTDSSTTKRPQGGGAKAPSLLDDVE